MKIVARTLIILAAALAVAGLTYAVAQSSDAQSLIASAGRGRPPGERGELRRQPGAELPAGAETPEFERGAGGAGFERGRGGEGHGASLAGAAQMARPFLIIAAFVAAGALLSTALRRPSRRPQAAGPAE